jgi:hypothetical protein
VYSNDFGVILFCLDRGVMKSLEVYKKDKRVP